MNEELIYEVNESNFQQLVLEKSKQLPVMVDFWSERCAPCRILGPILEEVARKYSGRIALAKVDVGLSPFLAAQFGVQGIPTVKIFRREEEVKEFVGVRSIGEIEKLLEGILPQKGASGIERANRLLAGGRWEEAAAIYQGVLGEDPENHSAHLGLGMIAFHQARWEEAERHLEKVESDMPGAETVPAMLARIYFEKIETPNLNELTKKLKENPDDPAALYSLGLTYAKGGEYERALDTLLKLIEIDRNFKDGAARKVYLNILEIIGRESESGKAYSRRLSMVLFS